MYWPLIFSGLIILAIAYCDGLRKSLWLFVYPASPCGNNKGKHRPSAFSKFIFTSNMLPLVVLTFNEVTPVCLQFITVYKVKSADWSTNLEIIFAPPVRWPCQTLSPRWHNSIQYGFSCLSPSVISLKICLFTFWDSEDNACDAELSNMKDDNLQLFVLLLGAVLMKWWIHPFNVKLAFLRPQIVNPGVSQYLHTFVAAFDSKLLHVVHSWKNVGEYSFSHEYREFIQYMFHHQFFINLRLPDHRRPSTQHFFFVELIILDRWMYPHPWWHSTFHNPQGWWYKYVLLDIYPFFVMPCSPIHLVVLLSIFFL